MQAASDPLACHYAPFTRALWHAQQAQREHSPVAAEVVEVAQRPLDLHLVANRQRLQVLAHLAARWEARVLVLPVHLQG